MSVQFANPTFLLLLAALALLAWRRRRLTRQVGSIRFSAVTFAADLPTSRRIRLHGALGALRFLALALVVVALARPQLGRSSELVPAEGIDIVVAFDVSYSMAAQDMASQSRFQVAKDIIQEFVTNRKKDRVGLVIFAGDAVTHSPLTLDYQAVVGILHTIDLDSQLPAGTAIGHGIANSVNLLRDSRAKSRVVVLLTDGQNNSGQVDPLKAARVAELLGVKVYTIGVGGAANFPGPRSPGGPGRQLRAADVVDEDMLKKVSESTGAAYFRATDPTTLRQVYEQIEQLEKSQVGSLRYATLDELAPWLLLAALGLVVVEAALTATAFRRLP
ncbi:MAG: VWA domain-containing protein [Chloroflexi bacterium]|nr:VWA domain-containing protein [Chloroflexota bacterium]